MKINSKSWKYWQIKLRKKIRCKRKKQEMERKGKIKGKKSICITIYMNSVIGEVACQSFHWKKNLKKPTKTK